MHYVTWEENEAIIEYNKEIEIYPRPSIAYYSKGIFLLLRNELIKFGKSE